MGEQVVTGADKQTVDPELRGRAAHRGVEFLDQRNEAFARCTRHLATDQKATRRHVHDGKLVAFPTHRSGEGVDFRAGTIELCCNRPHEQDLAGWREHSSREDERLRHESAHTLLDAGPGIQPALRQHDGAVEWVVPNRHEKPDAGLRLDTAEHLTQTLIGVFSELRCNEQHFLRVVLDA